MPERISTLEHEELGELDDLDTEAPNDPDILGTYLNEIRQFPLLDAAEEVELAKQIEAGLYANRLLAQADLCDWQLEPEFIEELKDIAIDGEAAKWRFFRSNLALVVSVARRHNRYNADLLDKIVLGNDGLLHAIEKFDFARGNKFSTYATWWIRQSIIRGLPKLMRTIKLPDDVSENITRVVNRSDALAIELGRQPEPEELAAALGMTVEKLHELRRTDQFTASLDKLSNHDDGEGVSLGGKLGDPRSEFEANLVDRLTVAGILSELEPEVRYVIEQLHGVNGAVGQKILELAKELGMKQHDVDRLASYGRAVLRAVLGGQEPPLRPKILTWDDKPMLRARRRYEESAYGNPQDLIADAWRTLASVGNLNSEAGFRLFELALETVPHDSHEWLRSVFGVGAQDMPEKGKGPSRREKLLLARLVSNLELIANKRWSEIDFGRIDARARSPLSLLLEVGVPASQIMTGPKQRRELVLSLLPLAGQDLEVLRDFYGLHPDGRPPISLNQLAKDRKVSTDSLSREVKYGLESISEAILAA